MDIVGTDFAYAVFKLLCVMCVEHRSRNLVLTDVRVWLIEGNASVLLEFQPLIWLAGGH